MIQPPVVSPARRSAYAHGSAEVPTILDEPDGWTTLSFCNINGQLFGQREIQEQYIVRQSLSLLASSDIQATPLAIAI